MIDPYSIIKLSANRPYGFLRSCPDQPHSICRYISAICCRKFIAILAVAITWLMQNIAKEASFFRRHLNWNKYIAYRGIRWAINICSADFCLPGKFKNSKLSFGHCVNDRFLRGKLERILKKFICNEWKQYRDTIYLDYSKNRNDINYRNNAVHFALDLNDRDCRCRGLNRLRQNTYICYSSDRNTRCNSCVFVFQSILGVIHEGLAAFQQLYIQEHRNTHYFCVMIS
jgi:hypothetical protein